MHSRGLLIQFVTGAVISGVFAAAVVSPSASASSGGHSITLRSNDQYLRVTFLTWKRTSHGSDPYDRPSPGHIYLAIKLKLQNLATKTYDDSPTNGAVLEDAKHHQYQATFGGPNPSLQGDVRIIRNDWVVGWITFEIPKKAKPRLFEFTLDSGFADNATGIWHFR